MAKDSAPMTPRRSQRHQPQRISYHTKAALSSSQTNVWSSPPIRVRPVERSDLPEDDREFDERDPAAAGQVRFYASFTRHKRNNPVLRAYGKNQRKRTPSGPGEVFAIGDVVLVASDTKKSSVGVITGMWEVVLSDDGGEQEEEREEELAEKMKVQIHWFLRPTQLASIRQKRDHFENEIYYSLSNSVVLSPFEILERCTVTSKAPESSETKSAQAWSITPSKKRSGAKARYVCEDEELEEEDDDCPRFYCGLAVDAQRGIYYPFRWEVHRDAAMKSASVGDPLKWDVLVEVDTPKRKQAAGWTESDDDEESDESSAPSTPSKKRKRENIAAVALSPKKRRRTRNVKSAPPEEPDFGTELGLPSSSEGDVEPSDVDIPKTPSKKQRRPATSATTTPRHKRVRNLAVPTPHSKAALRSRKRNKTLPVRPPPPELGQEYFRQLQNLPRNPWLRAMHVLHVAARPDALPCREEEYGRVSRSVEELIEEGSGGCVYISGVPGTGKTATVHAVVRELKRMAQNNETNPFTYVEINGLKIPDPHVSYNLLWEAISGHDVGADGHLTISSKEALKRLTKHFSGGASAGPGGHACVVLMDELDQLMTTKQDVVYNFFNWPTLVGSKLIVVAVANTMDLPERVMSGRVRSRLGMIRINFQPYTTLQLEKIVQTRLSSAKEGLEDNTPDVIHPDGVKFASMKVSSISGDARRVLDICRRTVELVQARSKTAKTDDVKEVIKVMQNSPTAAYIRECSLHERMMLAAVLKCIRKEGVEEVKWGDVQHQHVIYANILTGDDDPSRKPTFGELNYVLDSLLASRAMLIEDGAVALRKSEGERRVVLNLEQIEVERVLSELGGPRWKNALGV